jgi:hypothetical protein
MSEDSDGDAGDARDGDGDGDRILRIAGIALVAAIVVALGVMAIAFASGPPETSGINANWSLERVNDTHARIVHGGGEPVEGEPLVVTVDSYERRIAPPDVVVEGDAIVFEARPDQVTRLYLDAGRGESELLGTWRPER